MKPISLTDNNTSNAITRFARRNYYTYVKHYKARNLKPMPIEEFLKNYSS
ncbi:hypothetical protein [Lutibacter sp.]|nr:hypothetical protein [Lutibacter sp.]MCF6168821.1 hypothetical protein [Lutibacter sp.]